MAPPPFLRDDVDRASDAAAGLLGREAFEEALDRGKHAPLGPDTVGAR